MGGYGQGRQTMDAIWEYSPLLPQVTQELLAPSTVAVHLPISACGGWLFVILRSMIKVGNK